MYETMSEAIEAYDDMLNEIHEWPVIGGISFAPSDILRECDPIAYRVGFHDWIDAEGIDTDDLEDDEDLP